MRDPKTSRRSRLKRWVGIGALGALAILGCMQWGEFTAPAPPDISSDWRTLIADLRAFERSIGFRETKNFTSVSAERESFPFCGQASRLVLPYSYEDPAIHWLDSVSEEQCDAAGADMDTYFGAIEAMGEIGTPVTQAMIGSKLDRFVYLVIHEDCHDQFDLPYGIEEALCDVIAYHAMERFGKQTFRWYSRENRAIKSYARLQSQLARTTIYHYGKLEVLYARYRRTEISAQALLGERAKVFAAAEQELQLDKGTLNNIGLANLMTYSRHYPYLEKVFEALGRNLERTVEFFRRVDRNKPRQAGVMKRHGIADEKSLEFVRANEAAVVQTVTDELTKEKLARR